MKFNYLAYSDLIDNMSQFEIDIFKFVRNMIESASIGRYDMVDLYLNQAVGYLTCLLYNNIIDHDTFSLLFDYVHANRY